MKAIGYHLTWATSCFIDGGCGGKCYAHTNGDGDFVLLDSLGPPWPIHDCYLYRSASDGPGTVPLRTWDEVLNVEPDVETHRRVDFVGMVTDIAPARLSKFAGDSLSKTTVEMVRRELAGCDSTVEVVTGDGRRFTFFAKAGDPPVALRDLVGVRVRAKRILIATMFVATEMQRIG